MVDEVYKELTTPLSPFKPVPDEKISPQLDILGDELEQILSNLSQQGFSFLRVVKELELQSKLGCWWHGRS